MLKKVVSGGQTGADQGGLYAARNCDIPTGGWIPRGFLTENGHQTELADFGLVETKSDKYPPRTYANAKDSDGTIRIASNFDSPGEVCTLKAIEQYNKPYIDVEYRQPRSAQEVANWIRENNIDVLNVAGNRETFAPGIQRFVEEYLTEVFRLLK